MVKMPFMKIETIIGQTDLKLTGARKELLEVLAKNAKPLSYEELKNDISMDKATFYRNIAKFEEEGIVSSFEANDKKRYFEFQKTPHPHFVCSVCGKIECLKTLFSIDLEGYAIDAVIIKGKCPQCL